MGALICDFSDFQDSSSLNWRLPYPDISRDTWSSQREIRLRGEAPPWWSEIKPRLYDLVALAPDWDSRGSRAVSPDDLRDALSFLGRVMRSDTRAPWIGPLATGGLELTWHADNVEVEAVFDRSRNEQLVLVSVGDNESEAPVNQAESLFATVVDRLTAADPVAA